MLAERAASEGPRSTRAREVAPFHPATSWERKKERLKSFVGVAVLGGSCSKDIPLLPERACSEGARLGGERVSARSGGRVRM